MTTALIIVDVQNDFLPDGALAAPDGNAIIEPILKLAKEVDHVVATRDWHPEDHISFSDQPTFEDGSWPPHCIRETEGAQLHPDIEDLAEEIFNKGTEIDRDDYSGFKGESESGETLLHWLQAHGVDRITVAGLVTEFCVRATAEEGSEEGFRVRVNTNAVGSLGEDSARQARNDMAEYGVQISDREPRGDQEMSRDEAIEEAVLAIVDQAEDAEGANYHDMSAWLGSLCKWVREETERNKGEIMVTYPDAFFQEVVVIRIPAEVTMSV